MASTYQQRLTLAIPCHQRKLSMIASASQKFMPLFAGCTMAVSAAQQAYPQSFCSMPKWSLNQASSPIRSISLPPCLQPLWTACFKQAVCRLNKK